MRRTTGAFRTILFIFLAIGMGCAESSTPRTYHSHPYLAQSPWPIIHHSASQEASVPYAGPRGPEAGGVVDTYPEPQAPGPAPVLFDSQGYALAMKVNVFNKTHVFRKYDPATMTIVASHTISIPDPLSGMYSFVDNEDCWWNGYSQVLARLCTRGAAMSEDMHIDLHELFPGQMLTTDSIIGMNPLYTSPGKMDIAFVTQGLLNVHENDIFTKTTIGAKAGVVRVNKDRSVDLFLRTFTTENITNSIAVDPEGRIFVIANKHLYALALTPGTSGETLDILWSVPYDSGDPIGSYACPQTTTTDFCLIQATMHSVKFADGSGTTPTLLGPNNAYVGFADGARPMNIIVVRARDGSPVPVDIPVPFSDPLSQTENTITAYKDIFAIENNYGPGFAAYKLSGEDGNETVSLLWTTTAVFAPNAVPVIAGGSREVYAYEMQGSTDPWDPLATWYVTAMDLDSGAVKWRHHVGATISNNSLYAPLSIDDRGRMYIGLFGGLMRVR